MSKKQKRGQLGKKQVRIIENDIDSFLLDILDEKDDEKINPDHLRFDSTDETRIAERITGRIIDRATSSGRIDQLQAILEDTRDNINFKLSSSQSATADNIFNSISGILEQRRGRLRGDDSDDSDIDEAFQARQAFAQGALTDLRDEVFGDIDISHENLTEDEIFTISQDFLKQMDIRSLVPNEVQAISNEIIREVKNPKLRFILLEELNRVKALPLDSKDLLTEREINPIKIDGEVKLKTSKDTDELRTSLENINDLGKEFDEIEKITNNKQRNMKEVIALESYFDVIDDIINEIDQFGLQIDYNLDLGINPSQAIGDDDADSDDELGYKEQIRDEMKAIRDPEEKNLYIREKLNRARVFVSKFLKNELKSQRLPKAKRVSEVSDKANKSIKQFIEELRKEIKELKAKDELFAQQIGKEIKRVVKHPHATHNIGKILIHTDKNRNIKEIIINPDSTGNDVMKLAHSLSRTEGVLLDIDGNNIITIKGESRSFKKVLNAIMDFLAKNKNKFVSFIYRPLTLTGGAFVGGSFTHYLYNKDQSFHNIFLHNNFLPLDINRKTKFGGNLVNEFKYNSVRHYL